jgi:hypothetical protein
MDDRPPSVLILADPREMAESRPVWGTGGWLPAHERMALDWLTLCRLMGLNVGARSIDGFHAEQIDASVRWLVLACDPATVGDDLVAELSAAVDHRPLLLICQAADEHHPLASWLGIHATGHPASGVRLSGAGEAAGFSATLASPLAVTGLDVCDNAWPAAYLEDVPVSAVMSAGKGRVLVCSFNASELRDHDGAGTALMKHLISGCAPVAHASLDWHGVLIPRMDDPGSSEALLHDIYHHTCLGPGEWESLAAVLREREAKTSVGYVSGWVDAGNAIPGTLLIDGVNTERVAGRIHPSPRVRFESHCDGATQHYDHVAEYQSLQQLRREGLAEVELHGHTHIFPNRRTWLSAPDRFSNKEWFREFGGAAAAYLDKHPEVPHPVDEGLSALREYFDRFPSTLICPGEVFTRQVLVKALDSGLMQVSSYYLAFRHDDRLCWTQHVCAPYLDKPDPAWFAAGLPVVGCYHDFDIARHGEEWMPECLDRWQDAGCRRFMGLDDLNALLQLRMILKEDDHGWELHLHWDPAWPTPPRLDLLLHFPGHPVPPHIQVFINHEPAGRADITPSDGFSARLRLPPA